MPISNRVVELFAGVGGFHLAATESGWEVVWANQWEPGKNVQHAYDIYKKNFPETPTSNDDIASVIKGVPEHDLLVGGFPCQDYSVAATKAQGVQGKKGVLWWDIARVVEYREPPYILLENVDRLLKSPTAQRGRDFSIMLATLDDLGYGVEWRVLNAADYGHVQRRRRVFIFAWKRCGKNSRNEWNSRYRKCSDPTEWLREQGLFASTFASDLFGVNTFGLDRSQSLLLELLEESADSKELTVTLREQTIPGDSERLLDISEHWAAHKVSPFNKAGLMIAGNVWTAEFKSVYGGPRKVLRDIIENEVDDPWFYLDEQELEDWKYLKGAKREEREVKKTGFRFTYSEGALPFPDPLDRPSRTIITGEGGRSPSRFKHVIEDSNGRLRRLTPIEAERLNGFPDNWTDVGSAPTNFRYFSMGNALVVPLVADIMNNIQGEKNSNNVAHSIHRPTNRSTHSIKRMSIDEATARLREIIGEDVRGLAREHGVLRRAATGNIDKGWPGAFFEAYLGLQKNNRREPDFGDWELKGISLKVLKSKEITVKESMWITSLKKKDVCDTPFEQSHLLAKLRKVLMPARISHWYDERKGQQVEGQASILYKIKQFDIYDKPDVYEKIKSDYEEVQNVVSKKGFEYLSGRMGCIVQPRTKGRRDSDTRAFYLRARFIKEFMFDDPEYYP